MKTEAAPRRPFLAVLKNTFLTGNTFVITVLAFVSALVIGAIIIVLATPSATHAWRLVLQDPGKAFAESGKAIANAYSSLFVGSIGSPRAIAKAIHTGRPSDFTIAFLPLSETLVSTTPLMMAGLGIALAFRAGLFDIGGQGQLILGAAGATLAGFAFPALPLALHLPFAILLGAAFGAAWGFIPGFLKARTGAHEVITSMMMNYVGSEPPHLAPDDRAVPGAPEGSGHLEDRGRGRPASPHRRPVAARELRLHPRRASRDRPGVASAAQQHRLPLPDARPQLVTRRAWPGSISTGSTCSP